MKPEEIEKTSFAIIDEEAGSHDFSAEEWSIVRRIIHTSADFEYKETVRFHPLAIKNGVNAIRSGKTIITDTEMAKVGIRKRDLTSFGNNLTCLISDPEVMNISSKNGITRAAAAVDAALPFIDGSVYVIGNAPTALLRLIELITDGSAKPALVVGFPVGFVNASESKWQLTDTDYPFISNKGRKGGSNVAASVVNALIELSV
ncbi:MAG: precorrin-8X methylmutase [Desulfobacteraceae bacterium]|nr:precorrin-8X methylmutase [Desulfobacteraceae bacterium]